MKFLLKLFSKTTIYFNHESTGEITASLIEQKGNKYKNLKKSDDEMEATFIECGGKWNGDFWKIEDADFHPFLRTIEAKLKEKNT